MKPREILWSPGDAILVLRIALALCRSEPRRVEIRVAIAYLEAQS